MSFKLLGKWLICQRILLFPGIKPSYWLLKTMAIRNDITMHFCCLTGVPFEGTERRGGGGSLCSWKWKHLNSGVYPKGRRCQARAPNSGWRQKPSPQRVRFWKYQRSRWTANQWLIVPAASPDSGCRADALAVRRLGSESQNEKEHKPVPQKILAKMLTLTSQWQGRGKLVC